MVHGQYQKTEIHNLGRFISVMKFRPLEWRSAHPYVLADRMEDLTSPEEVRQDGQCDRTVSLYGYVRGTHLKTQSAIHIPGRCADSSQQVVACVLVAEGIGLVQAVVTSHWLVSLSSLTRVLCRTRSRSAHSVRRRS